MVKKYISIGVKTKPMRIKLKDIEKHNKLCVIEAAFIEIEDSGHIHIGSAYDTMAGANSTVPLKSIDQCLYEQWLDSLMNTGYLDLSSSGYFFKFEESDEDDEQEIKG